MRFPGNEDGKFNGVSGIYRIVNLLNGKSYVGQSSDLGRRFHNYLREVKACTDTENCRSIIKAMREEGDLFFEFEVICTCPREMLGMLEEYYALFFMAHDKEYGYNVQGIYQYLDYSKTNIEYRKRLRESHLGSQETPDTKRKKGNKIYVVDENEKIIYICDTAKLFGAYIGIGKDMVKNCLRDPCRHGPFRFYYADKNKRNEILSRQRGKYLNNIGKLNWDKLNTDYIRIGEYIDKISDDISVETTRTPDGKYEIRVMTYENTVQVNYSMLRRENKSRIPEES